MISQSGMNVVVLVAGYWLEMMIGVFLLECDNKIFFYYYRFMLIMFIINSMYIGRICKTYRCIDDDYISAKNAYVGLAPPGDVGSWQRECKVSDFKK